MPGLDAVRAHFDAALTNIGQGFASTTGTKGWVVANARYCEMSGLTPDEAQPGTPFREMLARSHASGNFADLAVENVYASRMRRILTRHRRNRDRGASARPGPTHPG